MIGSFVLLMACFAGIVYLVRLLTELLEEIEDKLHGPD